MTLDKAIENIKQVLTRRALWDNEKMGLQLGIEALEREQTYRKHLTEMGCSKDIKSLPTETAPIER